MKQNKLKIISAKDLGRLNLPDFCPRCFWIERHLDKPPSVFPGIFSTLDAVTKRSTHRSFAQRGIAPGWLPVEDAAEVIEDDTYFKLPVKEGGWVLIGRPDDIFRTSKNTYHIVDYKTAKWTARQDELFPLYEVQLNCYAYLASEYGFDPVTELSLIYCQPNEDLDNDDELSLGFKTYKLGVDLNIEIVPKLLIEARRILDLRELPAPSAICKGLCQWAAKLF